MNEAARDGQKRLPDIPVVYFHSVAPAKNPRWAWSFLTLGLRYFEDFLVFLKNNRWQTIPLAEYVAIRKNGQKPGGKTCCLTFDDGYLDNYVYAWPLLKKYGFQATIFVSPEFVDCRRDPAQTLDDVWSGKATLAEIERWGFLTWEEMRIMELSGHVDIESHTLTHSKYFVSDRLAGFHHPQGDCLYPAGNLFPEQKPYYIANTEFEKLIPFGYPFFEQSSALIARRAFISEEFNSMICALLKGFDWEQSGAMAAARTKTEAVYRQWQKEGRIITRTESEAEYDRRVTAEIVVSKKTIEANLSKTVKYLCWPHGDNNERLHELALASGFEATTTGSKQKIAPTVSRIAQRTAVSVARKSLLLTRWKTRYRLGAAAGSRLLKAIHGLRQKIG
jgi:hypothetical protein